MDIEVIVMQFAPGSISFYSEPWNVSVSPLMSSVPSF
jgi:hypothetical protein